VRRILSNNLIKYSFVWTAVHYAKYFRRRSDVPPFFKQPLPTSPVGEENYLLEFLAAKIQYSKLVV
jgi:hypothetical protein